MSIVNISGSDEEVIPLLKPVKAVGNIEIWLGALEKEMKVRTKTHFMLPMHDFARSKLVYFLWDRKLEGEPCHG